ncbi:hypothetical protein [Bauldia sp.]|uniref:hypothetical protein n=1 Tax=Bauldia sp. TaxID=2575872 RepID=UPI003BA9FCA1
MSSMTGRGQRNARWLALLGLCVVAAFGVPMALAQSDETTGPLVRIDGDNGDLNLAGAGIVVRGNTGSIEAAGATIDIDATVSGSVRAAGAEVTVSGDISSTARVGGALVEISGTVIGDVFVGSAVARFDAAAANDVTIAGASVDIGTDATIGGNLSAWAASAKVTGTITGDTEIFAAAVTFEATTAKTVTIAAEEVYVGPNANITGDLVVQSDNEPEIADGAQISGQVRLEEPRPLLLLPSWLLSIVGAVVMAAGAVLAAAILLLLGRGTFEDALDKAAFRPISSGFIGLAILILLPIAAALLFVTIIGGSFGLALLALLPFLFVAGHATIAACIGVWIFDRSGGPRSPGRLILYTIAGAVIFAIVWLIPWIGAPVMFIATVVGLGAYVRTLMGRMRHSEAVPI